MQGQLAEGDGEGDVPVLNELGVAQAHAVAPYLAKAFADVSCIYTSDLKRAVQVMP